MIQSKLFSCTYIIYGTTSVDINASDDQNTSQRFFVNSVDNYLTLDYSVSRAGDLNQDGIDDVIIRIVYTSYGSSAFTGAAIVIYGKQGGNISSINLDGGLNITRIQIGSLEVNKHRYKMCYGFMRY